MPSKVRQVTFRGGPEVERQIADLAKAWGGVSPASIKDVMVEAIRRAHAAEFKAKKKSQESPH